jgi:hypothetical protein
LFSSRRGLERGVPGQLTRVSSYFIPVPRFKKRRKQLVLDTEWTEDRLKEIEFKWKQFKSSLSLLSGPVC